MIQLLDRVGGEFLVYGASGRNQGLPTAATLTTGNFVVTWTDYGTDNRATAVRAQLYDSSGAKVGQPFQVSTLVNSQFDSTATALAGGGFLITWTDFSGAGGDSTGAAVRAQRFDAAGAKVGAELLVNTTTAGDQYSGSAIALSNGGFIITWPDRSGTAPDSSSWGIRAQIYNASGVKVGNEFLVNSTTTDTQYGPSIASYGSAGGFVVTWWDAGRQGADNNGDSVKAQLFSANGTKVGGEILVNTTVAGDQEDPQVAQLAGGGFVIVWEDHAGASGQIFDASGAKVGTEFKLGATASQDLAVVGSTSGGFLVSWMVFSGDNGDADQSIEAQLFDASGAKIGAEFRVNMVTANAQQVPQITALGDDRFALVWQSGNAFSSNVVVSEIKAQIIGPSDGTIDDLTLSTATVSETAVTGSRVATISAVGPLNDIYSYEVLSDSLGGAFGTDGKGGLVVTDSSKLDAEAAATASVTVRATDANGTMHDKIFTIGLRDEAIEDRYRADDEKVVNTITTGAQGDGSAATLTSGRYVMTWSDGGFNVGTGSGLGGDASSGAVKGQIFEADGAKVGGEFLVNTSTLNTQFGSSVTALSSGGFVVTWLDAQLAYVNPEFPVNSAGIRAQIFSESGAKVGPEITVYVPTDYDRFFDGSLVGTAALQGGGFMSVWSKGTSFNSPRQLVAQAYDASGAKVGSQILLATDSDTVSNFLTPQVEVLALPSGNILVAWVGNEGSTGYGLRYRIFTSAGVPTGPSELAAINVSFDNSYPTLTLIEGKGVLFTWSEFAKIPGKLYGQLLSFTGGGIGVTMELLDGVGYGQYAVSATASGDFAVAWTDSTRQLDPSQSRVVGQVFTIDGKKVGSEFLVNETTDGRQDAPILTAAGSGGFVAAWTDSGFGTGADGDLAGLVSRHFSVVDHGPRAVSDALDAVEGTPRTIQPAALLGNDSDLDGDDFSIVSVQAVSGGTVVLEHDGSITFTAAQGFSGAAKFTYLISDGGVAQSRAEVTVNVAASPEAPTGRDDTLTVVEDSFIGLGSGNFNFSDADGDDFLSVTITDVTGGSLFYDANGGDHADAVQVTAASSTYGLSAFGNGDKLLFKPSQHSNAPGSLTFTLKDDSGAAGADTSAPHTLTFNVTPANDAPVLSTPSSVNATEQTAVSILPSGSVADIDLDARNGGNGDYAGATFSVNRNPATNATEDVFTLVAGPDFTIDGSALKYEGQIFGTISVDGSAGLIVINFTSQETIATNALVDQVVQSVRYTNTSDTPPASVDLAVGFEDGSPGGGQGAGETDLDVNVVTVNIAAVNDAPVNSVPGEQRGTEDTNLVFSADTGNAIKVADADAAGGDMSVTLGVLRGTLTLATVAGLGSVTNNGSATVTLTGSVDEINAALNGLVYRGTLNSEGADTLTIVTSDNGLTGLEGDKSDTDQVDILLADDGKIDGGGGDDELPGTAQSDLFDLRQGGDDDADGLAGDDGFYFGKSFTSSDKIDGGEDTDVVILQGNYDVTFGADSLVNVEFLSLQSGSSTRYGDLADNRYDYDVTFIDANVGEDQRFVINASQLLAGESFTFDGSDESDGSFLIYGGFGDDLLTGGSGNDIFHFEGSRFGAGDSVTGGDGADAVVIRAAGGMNAIVFGETQLIGIEAISVSDRFGLGSPGLPSYDLTLANGNVTPGGTLIVNASTLLDPTQTLKVDGSAVEDGNLKLYGGAGGDTLIGGDGNDLIYAAGGADTMTGGEGSDTFQVRNLSDTSSSSLDQILDFVSGSDRIHLGFIDADANSDGDQAFSFVGDAFSGNGTAGSGVAGELRAYRNGGSGPWFVEGDIDGDGAADFQISVNLAPESAPSLAGSDFIL